MHYWGGGRIEFSAAAGEAGHRRHLWVVMGVRGKVETVRPFLIDCIENGPRSERSERRDKKENSGGDVSPQPNNVRNKNGGRISRLW